MKLLKKTAILLILTVSYFVVSDHELTYAQTSCPARDACLDTAYNNYVNGIALANQNYISCEQSASGFRNQCLDSAEAEKSDCELQADQTYENNLARCQVIADPSEAEYCVQELESIRQQAYSVCASVYDSSVQSCWWGYYGEVAGCEAVFFAYVGAAQAVLATEQAACDQLC